MRAAPRRGLVVLAIAAIGAGAALRFMTVSHLWLDEALSVDIARLPLGDIPGALRHDGHPPLYYALLHGWMQVFGEGDVAVRALSGVLGLATLPLVWFGGRRLGGTAAAWAATALLALSPFAIRYSNEARMYALVMLLVAAGHLLLVRAVEVPTWQRLVPVALVTGALLLSHYWALWLAGATLAVLLWRARWGEPAERRACGRVSAAIVVGGVLLVPWLPSMLQQSAHTGTPWADPARPAVVLATSIRDVGGGGFAEADVLGTVLVVLALIGAFGRRVGERIELSGHRFGSPTGRIAVVVGLTMAIGAAAGVAASAAFASRYIAVVVPLFVLVAAAGVACFRGWAQLAVLGVALGLGLLAAGHNVGVDRTQAGEAAAAIRAGGRAGDLVIVCPDQLGPSLRRLLPDVDLVTYPDQGDGDRVDWYDYAARNAAADPARFLDEVLARRPGPRQVWLVSSDSYRTLDGQCPALQALLTTRSAHAEPVVAEDGETYFEHEAVARFELAG